jgi:uncharacterized protein (TIGR00251 family)
MTSSKQMKTNILDLYIRPNAVKTTIDGFHGDKIKIRIASPPEKGKANRELISLLSRVTGVSRDKIRIISGITSNYKRVCIDGDSPLDYSEILLNNTWH